MTTTFANVPSSISVEKAAEILGISRRHAYALAQRGELPVVRLGGALRVPTHRLLELLDGKPTAEAS